MLSFDLLLFYRDCPQTLHCWLKRLLRHTDFLDRADRRIIICDSGTPKERRAESLAVMKHFSMLAPITWVIVDTSEARSTAPKDCDTRCASLTYNTALKHVCQNELAMFSILSVIYTPNYFRDSLEIHTINPKLVLQPRQYLVASDTYFTEDYGKPFREAIHGKPMGLYRGMPDWSVRRSHLMDIGGWDEDYKVWGMADLDCLARLTGKTELGWPASSMLTGWSGKELGDGPPEYANKGLMFCRAEAQPWLFSLVVCGYPGYSEPDDAKDRAAGIATAQFYDKYSVVHRESPTDAPFEIIEVD